MLWGQNEISGRLKDPNSIIGQNVRDSTHQNKER